MGLLHSTATPLVWSGTGVGVGVANVLDTVDVPRQEQSEWCWCAATVGIARHYDRLFSRSQCQAANEVLGIHDACVNSTQKHVNKPWELDKALGEYSLSAGKAILGPIKFADVVKEIGANRPIGAYIQEKYFGRGHVVVIRGYRESGVNGQALFIDDPTEGAQAEVNYEGFKKSYLGWGRWYATYLTKSHKW